MRSAISACARVSKTDGTQSPDLQRGALETAGVDDVDLYLGSASDVHDDPAGLDSCQRAPRKDDVLVVLRLDRLGRNVARLVETVQDLSARGVDLRVLARDGMQVVDTTIAAGRLVQGDGGSRAGMLRGLRRGHSDAGFGRDAAPWVMRSSRNSLASRRLAKAAEGVHSSGWSVVS